MENLIYSNPFLFSFGAWQVLYLDPVKTFVIIYIYIPFNGACSQFEITNNLCLSWVSLYRKEALLSLLNDEKLIQYLFARQLLKTQPNNQHSVWGNGGHAFVRINWYDVNTTGSLLYCILGDNVRAGCQWTQTGNCGLWHLDLACLLQSFKKGCCSMSETAWWELGNECMSSASMTTMDVIPGKCICMTSWLLKK